MDKTVNLVSKYIASKLALQFGTRSKIAYTDPTHTKDMQPRFPWAIQEDRALKLTRDKKTLEV